MRKATSRDKGTYWGGQSQPCRGRCLYTATRMSIYLGRQSREGERKSAESQSLSKRPEGRRLAGKWWTDRKDDLG